MKKLRARIEMRPAAAIDVRGWDEIWRLTSRFYDADRNYVERRLKSHQTIALFRNVADRRLVGMAAIEVDVVQFEGRHLVLIFTSHMLIDEKFRGTNLLQRCGARCWLRAWLDHPLKRKFWAFDTFSYRSYLLMPRDLETFWPRHDEPTPPWEARLMAEYGQRKFGSAWLGDGVIAHAPQKRLLPQSAPLQAEMLNNPDLAFFQQANPGHAEGDMLLCLVPLTLNNWWSIFARALSRTLRRWSGMPPEPPQRLGRQGTKR